METVSVTLPSGAELKITPAPFVEAKALYQAFLAEMKSLKLDHKAEVDVNFWKDIFCTALASKQIEQAIDDELYGILDETIYGIGDPSN